MASKEHDLVDTGITFASGAAYGMTTVAVGQPFDTIKTVVQSSGEGTVAATRKVPSEFEHITVGDSAAPVALPPRLEERLAELPKAPTAEERRARELRAHQSRELRVGETARAF